MSSHPYHVYLYGPIYPLVTGNFLRILGIHETRTQVLWLRSLSLLFLLTSIYLLWRFVLKPQGNSALVLGLTVLLILPKFSDYATVARNDTFFLIFSVLALSSFLNWIERKTLFWLVTFSAISALCFFVRQNGVFIYGAGIIWLLIHREFRHTAASVILFITFLGLPFLILPTGTLTTFIEHTVLSNLRPFRPIDSSFFDMSFWSFTSSYLLCGFLTMKGLFLFKNESSRNQNIQFVALAFFVSTVATMILFVRAGGDVNYFFESLVLGSLFTMKGVQFFIQAPHLQKTFVAVFSVQALLISFIYFRKSQSTLRHAFVPFEEAANYLKASLSPFGLVAGYQGPNLTIHLGEWAYHGPDVTNASVVVVNGHPSFRWILKDIEAAVKANRIQSVVVAQDDCGSNPIALEPDIVKYFHTFKLQRTPYDWLCIFKP